VALFAARYRELMRQARAQGIDEGQARVLAASCLEGAAKVLDALLARGGSGPQGHA
jgi:pyrroline-5-carboxylate reductase